MKAAEIEGKVKEIKLELPASESKNPAAWKEKLKPLFGKPQITMFELAKVVKKLEQKAETVVRRRGRGARADRGRRGGVLRGA